MESKCRKGPGPAITAVLFVMAAATNGCQEPTQVAAKSPTPVHLVDVTLYPSSGDITSSEDLHYSASVLPFAEASLSFKSAGYVTEIKQVMGADGRRRDIGAGDYVARGTTLAQIRHQDLKNELDQATATLHVAEAQQAEATKDYERAKTLYASDSLIKPDFDQAQAKFDSTLAAVDQAKANLHQAQLVLADADLTAPFSGYILARNIELGNLAAPGLRPLRSPIRVQSKSVLAFPTMPSGICAWGNNSVFICRTIRKSTTGRSPVLPRAPMRKIVFSPSR